PSIVPVLEEKGYKAGDIKLLGTDGDPSALDLIRSGWITSTVGVPMIQQVGGMFQFLDDVLNGTAIKDGNYEVRGVKDIQLKNEEWGPTLYLPGTIITKENVDDPNLWGNLKQ
ncbi:MAG: sugar ABC transporter substrate-binding protein, partial [Candidatus Humimicrobiaceae bacterium]